MGELGERVEVEDVEDRTGGVEEREDGLEETVEREAVDRVEADNPRGQILDKNWHNSRLLVPVTLKRKICVITLSLLNEYLVNNIIMFIYAYIYIHIYALAFLEYCRA